MDVGLARAMDTETATSVRNLNRRDARWWNPVNEDPVAAAAWDIARELLRDLERYPEAKAQRRDDVTPGRMQPLS